MYNTQEHNLCVTNSFISLGSNIQFSTNTEKEQVIIKETCNNEQTEQKFCFRVHFFQLQKCSIEIFL
jgi:hypothetical protein